MGGLISLSGISQGDTQANGMVDLGTHRLHFYAAGSGPVCIVLDVGIGESYLDWLPLLDEISPEIRIFCYDRAGYGESEMGPLPRSAVRAAAELETLLDRADVQGPYLLVGHSLGALNLQIFAHRNREKTKGMLLLDPPPLDWIGGKEFPELKKMAEEQTKTFEKAAESVSSTEAEEQKKREQFFHTLASEHREMFSSNPESLRAISSFGDLPLIVIASGIPNPAFGRDAAGFQRFWNDQCKSLAGKSSRGKYWLASESRHHIHRDDPEMVLEAIRDLISAKQ